MKNKELLKYCLDSLSTAGADKSQCILNNEKKYEMNVAGGEISLLRTTFDTEVDITTIKDAKKANIILNKTDKASIDAAIINVMEMSKTAAADEANDISPMQPAKEFTFGEEKPDLDKMYDLLKKFTSNVKELYPKIILEETRLDFTLVNEYFINSNGVDFKTTKGIYKFYTLFSSKDGEKSSSFNSSKFSIETLEKDLLDCGSINLLMKQSEEQLNTKPLEGKFTGDILITPDCLSKILNIYAYIFLNDSALISRTSILKDKLNEEVASPKFTLHSKPVSEEITDGYFITPDGFEAKNSTIIDEGVLKTFILSQYGANKTGKVKAVNNGNAFIVEPGDKSLHEIIKSIDKGILLGRFSGGMPSSNGNFSGVAKNSYYIENGEIKYPISETMISGNLYEMFKMIKSISKERINYGDKILPWVCSENFIISGK